jgi:hypothetical protein
MRRCFFLHYKGGKCPQRANPGVPKVPLHAVLECEDLHLSKARKKDRRGADQFIADVSRLNPGQAHFHTVVRSRTG